MDDALTELIRLPEGVTPRVSISREIPPAPSAEVERAWGAMSRDNPRLYDAPVLSVVSFDGVRGEFLARRDRYKRLAVQPRVMTGVRLLAVTGVLTARDRAGGLHVFLGRRGAQTRVYPRMWELGPSGGVSCPAPSIDALSAADLVASLVEEIEEEAGLGAPASARPIAVVRDRRAFSDDLVFLCDAGELERQRAGGPNWEYEEHAWVAASGLRAFDAAHGPEIIPPTRAILRELGWA